MTAAADVRAIVDLAKSERARRELVAFCKRMDGTFQDPPHIRKLGALLEAVERGENRRLIVTIPPRHGKSRMLQLFTAMYLGKAHARGVVRNVITASHSAELAERNSRASRAAVEDDRWPFPERLSIDSSAMHRWNLSDGSGLYAIGVGGNITGRGADLLILDDVQHDESTEAERESTWRWYCEIAVPRLEPNAAVVIIATRWHASDLVGRILEHDVDFVGEWQRLDLPALAFTEADAVDAIGRHAGDALWPARFPSAELLLRKAAMGSRAFEAQFQQNPLPAEGALIKASWLETRYDRLPEFESVIAALDAAAKTGVSNDYSAIAVIGKTRNQLYLLDVVRRRVEFPELIRMAQAVYDVHKPTSLYVEDTSNAVAMIQQLRRDTTLPIVPVKPHGSKLARVEAITGLLESGRVVLPREAPWLNDFERELLAFPNGKHDDMVDAFAMALAKLDNRGSGFSFGKIRNLPRRGDHWMDAAR